MDLETTGTTGTIPVLVKLNAKSVVFRDKKKEVRISMISTAKPVERARSRSI